MSAATKFYSWERPGRYDFSGLQIGKPMLLPGHDHNLGGYLAKYRKRGWIISTRTTPEGVLITRLAEAKTKRRKPGSLLAEVLIEEGIPIWRKQTGPQRRGHLREMNIGDSAYLDIPTTQAGNTFAPLRRLGFDYTVRREGNGCRVWRIK